MPSSGVYDFEFTKKLLRFEKSRYLMSCGVEICGELRSWCLTDVDVLELLVLFFVEPLCAHYAKTPGEAKTLLGGAILVKVIECVPLKTPEDVEREIRELEAEAEREEDKAELKKRILEARKRQDAAEREIRMWEVKAEREEDKAELMERTRRAQDRQDEALRDLTLKNDAIHGEEDKREFLMGVIKQLTAENLDVKEGKGTPRSYEREKALGILAKALIAETAILLSGHSNMSTQDAGHGFTADTAMGEVRKGFMDRRERRTRRVMKEKGIYWKRFWLRVAAMIVLMIPGIVLHYADAPKVKLAADRCYYLYLNGVCDDWRPQFLMSDDAKKYPQESLDRMLKFSDSDRANGGDTALRLELDPILTDQKWCGVAWTQHAPKDFEVGVVLSSKDLAGAQSIDVDVWSERPVRVQFKAMMRRSQEAPLDDSSDGPLEPAEGNPVLVDETQRHVSIPTDGADLSRVFTGFYVGVALNEQVADIGEGPVVLYLDNLRWKFPKVTKTSLAGCTLLLLSVIPLVLAVRAWKRWNAYSRLERSMLRIQQRLLSRRS